MILRSRSIRSALMAYFLLILPFASCLDGPSNVTEGPDESYSLKKLRQELLITRQYDRISRPVKNHLTQTKVDMRLTINEFVELDTVNSILVTDAWFHITWRDEFLSWEPAEYQQLKQIHMNPNEIWKPDIVLINTANQDNLLNIFTDSEILVNSTGDVTWITMGLLRSKCPIWAYDYPFTVRPVNCRLTFCSLIYQSHEVNITTPGGEFFLAGPWFVNPRLQFINITGERYERYYDGYGTYSFESVTIQFKRRDNAMPLIVSIPTLTACLLTLCMFLLPINWSVRIQLAIVAILIQLLLILYIGLQLGSNAIGLARPVSYLRDDLFLSSLALVLTLLFRRLLSLADWLPPVPYLVSSLLAGPLARLLCFGISTSDYATAPASSLAANAAKSPFGHQKGPHSGPRRAARHHQRAMAGSSHLGDHVSLVDDLEGATQDEDQATVAGGPSAQLEIPNDLVAAYGGRGLDQVVVLSGGQHEWMQIIVFCDRIMFIFFALVMLPRLI